MLQYNQTENRLLSAKNLTDQNIKQTSPGANENPFGKIRKEAENEPQAFQTDISQKQFNEASGENLNPYGNQT